MQIAYYLIGFLFITFMLMVSGRDWDASYILSWEHIRPDTSMGWTLALVWLLDTFFSVVIMAVVVGRSKLALDFSLTLHGIHLAVVWSWSKKFPRSWFWWALQAVSTAIMVFFGTWMTQWRELRRVFFEDFELADIQKSRAST